MKKAQEESQKTLEEHHRHLQWWCNKYPNRPVPDWIMQNLLFAGRTASLRRFPDCVATITLVGVNTVSVRLANDDLEYWFTEAVVLVDAEPRGVTQRKVVIVEYDDEYAEAYRQNGYEVRILGFSRSKLLE